MSKKYEIRKEQETIHVKPYYTVRTIDPDGYKRFAFSSPYLEACKEYIRLDQMDFEPINEVVETIVKGENK